MPSPLFLNKAKELLKKYRSLENTPSRFKNEFAAKVPIPNTIAGTDTVTAEQYENIKHSIYKGKGFGTMLELPVNFVRKKTPLNKVITDDKYETFLHNFYEKINNADISLGEKIVNKSFEKPDSKVWGKVGKLFSNTEYLPLTHVVDSAGNKIPSYTPMEMPRITAPLTKAKGFAVPLLTFTGAYELLEGKKNKGNTSQLANEANPVNEETVNNLYRAAYEYAINDIIKEADLMGDRSIKYSDILNKIASKVDKTGDSYQSYMKDKAKLYEKEPHYLSNRIGLPAAAVGGVTGVLLGGMSALGDDHGIISSMPSSKSEVVSMLKGSLKGAGIAAATLGALGYGAGMLPDYFNRKDLKTLNTTAEELREVVIDKIASTALALKTKHDTKLFIDTLMKEAAEKNEKMKEVSQVLKKTSDTISNLNEKVSSLTEENKNLKLQVLAKERSTRATKLANDMVLKGMIKKSELSNKIDYVMDLSDDNFEVLNQTVQSVPYKKATVVQNGLDKLSFMLAEDSNMKQADSLQQAILDFRTKY